MRNHMNLLGSVAGGLLIAVALARPGLAQINQVFNPGFEMGPTRTQDGNLFVAQNSGNAIGWFDAGGASLNVVQVDGPGGSNYGNDGPENDATGMATTAVKRRYLDIASGSNTVFQRFVPQCTGDVDFGAWFSTRDDESASASLSILQGDDPDPELSPPVVGASNEINLPAGASSTDPWVPSLGSANLIGGTPYMLAIYMDNNTNMDEAFVHFSECDEHPDLPDVATPDWTGSASTWSPPTITVEPVVDPCCPPWNADFLRESLFYRGTPDGVGGNYSLKFDLLPVRAQLQAYLNYVKVVKPQVTQMVIQVSLHDDGANEWPESHPNAVGAPYYAAGLGAAIGQVQGAVFTPFTNAFAQHVNYFWQSGIWLGTATVGPPGPAPGQGWPGFPPTMGNVQTAPVTYPMQVNRWYRVHTGMWLDGGTFFDAKCSEQDYFVRVQGLTRGGDPQIEFLSATAQAPKATRLPAEIARPIEPQPDGPRKDRGSPR